MKECCTRVCDFGHNAEGKHFYFGACNTEVQSHGVTLTKSMFNVGGPSIDRFCFFRDRTCSLQTIFDAAKQSMTNTRSQKTKNREKTEETQTNIQ